jgi:hypothetical protein
MDTILRTYPNRETNLALISRLKVHGTAVVALERLVVNSPGWSSIGLPAPPLIQQNGDFGYVQARAPASSEPRARLMAPLDQLAAAADTVPRAAVSSPRSDEMALLSLLPATDDFDFDPGVVEPFLLVDDDGVPIGSRGVGSPRLDGDLGVGGSPSLDAIMAESDVGDIQILDACSMTMHCA